MNSKYNQALFTRIYEQKLWQIGQSVSGPGSEINATHNVRNLISELIASERITTVVDAACGDFNWQHKVIMEPMTYLGLDIVIDLIGRLNQEYSSKFREFRVADIVRDPIPGADLIICRDVLQHLDLDDAHQFMKDIWTSKKHRWLVASTNKNANTNTDIIPGWWRPLNLQNSPFNLPEPELLINDDEPTKQLGVWKITNS